MLLVAVVAAGLGEGLAYSSVGQCEDDVCAAKLVGAAALFVCSTAELVVVKAVVVLPRCHLGLGGSGAGSVAGVAAVVVISVGT